MSGSGQARYLPSQHSTAEWGVAKLGERAETLRRLK